MSFKRKMNRQILARERKIYRKEVARQIKQREATQQIERIKWIEYDDEDLFVSLEEAVHQGRKDTYTSEEMFWMLEEEREKIVNASISRDAGIELCLFDEDLDDAYADEEGIWGFCESKKLLIRGCFGTIDDGYHHNYHEAYLVESKRSDYKGLMGIVYFPFSLDDDLIEECGEDVRLVVLDMELKKAS